MGRFRRNWKKKIGLRSCWRKLMKGSREGILLRMLVFIWHKIVKRRWVGRNYSIVFLWVRG